MKKVVVCWDGSEGAKRALQQAEKLVDENVGEVLVLHVAEVFEPRGPDGQPLQIPSGVLDYLSMVNPMEQEMRRVNDISEREKATKAHKEFENMADYALQERFTYLNKEAPIAREAICDELKKMGDVEMVVVGSRGLGLVSRLVLGSVSEFIVHYAHCPVMVVR